MSVSDETTCPAVENLLRCNSDCMGCATYRRKVKEVEQNISGRDGLIQMLQDQIKKYETKYKDLLDEFEQMRFRYCSAVQELTSLREINKKLEEENAKFSKKDFNKIYPSLDNFQDELRNCKNQCKDLTNKLIRMDNNNISSGGNSGYNNVLHEVSNIENLISSQTGTLKEMLNKVLSELSNDTGKCFCREYMDKVYTNKSTGPEDFVNNNKISEMQMEIKKLSNLVDKYKIENENIRSQLLENEAGPDENEIAKLRDSLERKENEIYELKQKIDELDRENQEKESIFNDCRCRLTEQICQLQENNAMLGDTLTIVTQENKSNLENSNDLRRSLSEAEKRLQEYSVSVDKEIENASNERNEEILRLRNQIEQYRRQTDELRDRISESCTQQNEEIKELRRELEEKILENTEYEEENMFYCQKIDSLMKTLKELQLKAKSDSGTQAEISRIPSVVQTDEDGRILEMQDANKSLEGKLHEISSLQKNMEAKTRDYVKMKEQLIELRQSSIDLENEKSALLEKINSTQQELDKKQEELEEACCHRKKLQQQVSELIREHDDKTDQIQKISDELLKLSQSVTDEGSLKRRIRDLESENSRLTNELSAIRKCHCGDIAGLLNKEIERLQADNAKKQIMINQLEETVDRAKKIMCECEEEVKMLAEENKNLKDSLDEQSKDKEELCGDCERYKRLSDELKSELDKLNKRDEEETNSYRRQSEELVLKNEMLNSKYSGILEENKSKSAQFENLKNKLNLVEKENIALQSQIDDLKKEIDHYTDLLETNQKQYRRDSVLFETENKKLGEDYADTLRKFNNASEEIKDLKNRYNTLEAEKNNLNEIYEDLLASYKNKCAELKQLTEEYESCCNTNQKELDAIRSNLSQNQTEVIEARKESATLKEEIEKCVCEINGLKEDYKQQNACFSSEIDNLKDINQKLKDEHRKESQEYELCCNKKETEIELLRRNLSTSQTEAIQAKHEVENVKSEMKRCLCEITEKKDNYKYQNDALNDELERLKETHQKLKDEFRKKCAELEICYTTNENEIEALRQNLLRCKSEAFQSKHETEIVRKEMDNCICEMNKEKDMCMKQCVELNSELDRVKAELQQLKISHKKKCEDYDTLKDEFERCCKDSTSEIDSLKGKLSAVQSEAMEARRTSETIRKEMTKCICEIEMSQDEYKRRYEKLSSEKNRLHDEYRNSLDTQKYTCEELEQLRNKYKILSEQYKHKMGELSELKEKFEHCCEQSTQEINRLSRKLNASQTEAIECRNEICMLREEVDKCVCEIDCLKDDYKNEKAQLETENEHINEQYRSSMMSQQSLQDELQQLEAKYKILSEQYKEKITELSNLREQCVMASKKCQISRDEYKNLKKEYKEIKSMLSDQIRKYREDIAATREADNTKKNGMQDLKAQLIEKELQIKTLSVRVKEQENEIEYFKEMYQKLHAENSVLKAAINNLISNIEHKIKGTCKGLKDSSAEMIASEILNSLASIEDQIVSKTSYPRCNCIQEIMSKYGVVEACSDKDCYEYCDKVLKNAQLRDVSSQNITPINPSFSEATSTHSFCNDNSCDCAQLLAGDKTGKLNNMIVDFGLDDTTERLKKRCINIERCFASAMENENKYKHLDGGTASTLK